MKTKRLFAALLALIMAFSFAACGGNKKVYTEVKKGDTGNGPFDAATLCMNFSVSEGIEYEVSGYDVNLDLEEYNFRLTLSKDTSNKYFAEVGYAFNDTADAEYEAFIEAKTFDDTTIEKLDDVVIGDKTFKAFTATDSFRSDTYYIYTFNCTATNHTMNLIVTPLLKTPMDAPEITEFLESIVTK